MANISTYPIGTPAAKDLLAGTQLYTDDNGKVQNLTRNFSVANVAAFANSYSLGYTVYTAELSNFGLGTVAPVATIMQNTTGGNIVWTRTSLGKYVGTFANGFTTGKTFCMSQSQIVSNPSIGANGVNGVQDTNEWPGQQIVNVTSVNTVQVDHFVLAQSGAATKSDNIKIFLEIRIYS
jgi:hypothetical protein